MVTTQNQSVHQCFDFYPFGERINSSVGSRGACYDDPLVSAGGDAFAQKFTAKERDQESGLDYFGARYFSASLGRFTGVDPGNAGASRFDPQRWNGYSYVGNRPSTLVDPDGREPRIPRIQVVFPNPRVSSQNRQAFMAAARRIPVASGSAGLTFKAGGEFEVGSTKVLGAKFGGTLGEVQGEIGAPSTVKFSQGVEATFTLGPAQADFALGQEATIVGGDPETETVEPIAKAEFGLNNLLFTGDEVAISGKAGPLGGRVGVHTKPLSEAINLAVPALNEFFQSLLPDIQIHLEDPEDPERVP
ncbi:MAG: RHS repeat-associated core domain-containing protein [Bryobacterales bacterium]|nr:RHS repeat-associated core domain-containing protein [Bryobacterales bacterium]